MTRQTSDEKLAKLRQQRDQLNARIQKEASKAKAKARKEDTRRKIIAGAIALEHMEHESQFKEYFERLLSRHVKDTDKKLFDLS